MAADMRSRGSSSSTSRRGFCGSGSLAHCEHIWCCEENAGQRVIRGLDPHTTSFTATNLGIKKGILHALLADATAVVG
jgi:hypothetical protein